MEYCIFEFIDISPNAISVHHSCNRNHTKISFNLTFNTQKSVMRTKNMYMKYAGRGNVLDWQVLNKNHDRNCNDVRKNA